MGESTITGHFQWFFVCFPTSCLLQPTFEAIASSPLAGPLARPLALLVHTEFVQTFRGIHRAWPGDCGGNPWPGGGTPKKWMLHFMENTMKIRMIFWYGYGNLHVMMMVRKIPCICGDIRWFTCTDVHGVECGSNNFYHLQFHHFLVGGMVTIPKSVVTMAFYYPHDMIFQQPFNLSGYNGNICEHIGRITGKTSPTRCWPLAMFFGL